MPSVDELSAAWQDVCEIHDDYLLKHKVKLPKETSYKWVWLAALHHNKGEYVHKDIVSEAVRIVFPNAATDQQVRHLKRDGWNIKSDNRGGHKLDPYNPSSEFINDQARRSGRLSAANFEELKQVYGNRCATCGAKEGRPDMRYGNDNVKLQQGHRDPEKSSSDKDNLIPQCQFCNRAYKNDFTFDDKGRVRAIANEQPVMRASVSTKQKVFEYLKKQDL